MKIAMPVREKNIAPTIDFANSMVIWQTEGLKKGNPFNGVQEVIDFSSSNIEKKIEILRKNQVDVVICGAVSNEFQRLLEAYDIRLIGWICGVMDDVAQAFLDGSIEDDRYVIPGCCQKYRQRQCNRGGGRGRRRKGGR